MVLCQNEETGIEQACEADESDSAYSIFKIYHPVIPYAVEVPKHFYKGRYIEVYAKVAENAFRFSVNLLTLKQDVIFHFNPRFDRHYVVRNSRKKGVWQNEEIASRTPFPFQRGKGFRLHIFMDDEIFVAVNFVHFCTFKFREEIENAAILEITGDIQIYCLSICDSNFYPVVYGKKLPMVILPPVASKNGTRCLIKRKVKKIGLGCIIKITGRLKLLPQFFYINLQVGSHLVPHPIIPFHMNLRNCQLGLTEPKMIYNSWQSNKWETEEISEICPFAPGENFQLTIQCFLSGFRIEVNKIFVHQFPLRFSSFPEIDTLLIAGDLILSKISFLKSVQVN